MTITCPVILAVDLGKFNTAVCVFDLATKNTTIRDLDHLVTKRSEPLRETAMLSYAEGVSPERNNDPDAVFT